MSLTPQPSLDLNAETSIIKDDNDDGTGSIVVARTPPAIGAQESNFNFVYDDFNLASVSMPVYFIYLHFYFDLSCFCLFVCLPDFSPHKSVLPTAVKIVVS